MGIYIFSADYLYELLARDVLDPASAHDFGRNIIPMVVNEGHALAHPFSMSCVRDGPEQQPYWRDVGTIDAYWSANIDLTATVPELNLYDTSWPIWTYQEQLPPAKFVHNMGDRIGMAIESTVSGGCIISGRLDRSLLFSKCRVHSHARVAESVLLPAVEIGRGARLTKCVVDHGCVIPDGFVVGEDPELDAKRFYRSPGGVTLITRRMLEELSA